MQIALELPIGMAHQKHRDAAVFMDVAIAHRTAVGAGGMIPDVVEVIAELVAVAGIQSHPQLSGFARNPIENAAIQRSAAKPFFRSGSIAEQAFENDSWIHLHWQRGGGRRPADRILIDTAVP